MVKNKKVLILLLVLLASFNHPVYSRDKSIKYLPANQNIEMVSKDYPSGLPKGEIYCKTCADYFARAKKCADCVDLKELCPDCCLTTTSPKAIKCSKDDTSKDYNCSKIPFTFASCEQIECGSRSGDTDCDTLVCSEGSVSSGSPYGLQRRGCPDAYSDELAPSGCSGCTISGTGMDRVWTCPKTSCTSSPSPSFQTCSKTSAPPRCDDLGSYYDVTAIGAFYEYKLNFAFKDCINTCTAYADAYEECRDRVDCCERVVCKTGYTDNCTDSNCEKRIAAPECDEYTRGKCIKLNQQAQECLEGGTEECFKEIDRAARYDFTARSGEAYNVIWQINTEPLLEAKNDENTKFYTMVKVVGPFGKVVYASMLHQKSLNAAFSIYGSTLISKGTFKPGKRYQIQVHYFMNDDVDTEYQVAIKHLSLIVTRVRE